MQQSIVDFHNRKNLSILTALFLFTTFSGALRKWGINSSIVGNVVLAIQLMIPFCIGFCVGLKPVVVATNRMFGLLIIYIIYLLFAASNSLNLTIFHGIAGVVIHLGFWFAVYIYINNREIISVEKLLNVFAVIIVVEVLLGLIQYSLPATHILNRYVKSDDSGVAMVGSAVRVTGTFSYISGYTGFIVLATFVNCALMKLNKSPLIVTISMGLTLIACLISGSRGTTGFFVITTLGYILLNYKGGKGMIYLVQILIIAGLAFFINTTFNDPLKVEEQVEESYDNFESRVTQGQSEGQSRLLLPITELFTYEDLPFFGIGLGACYQGVNTVMGVNPYFYNHPEGEVETVRTMIEGGPVLLIFKMLLFIALVTSLSIDKRFTSLICILVIFTVPIVYNIYNSFYLFLGLILLDKVTFLDETQKKIKS